LRPRSYVETERHLLVNAKPLHHRPVAAIDRRAVAALLAALVTKHGAVAANCIRADLSGYFAWLIGEGLVDNNPVAYTNKAPTNSARTRLVTQDELREIWQAIEQIPSGDFADIVKLLLFTAARANEIGALAWSEIDFERAELALPAERVKNHR